jgi:hypothetical protein
VASNVLFTFSGQTDQTEAYLGTYTGTSLQPSNPTGIYYYWMAINTTYLTVINTKYRHLTGISTITFYSNIWQQGGGSNGTARCKVLVNGALSGIATGTINRTTPEWVTSTVDVSSLTNNTVYDVAIQLSNSVNAGVYLGAIYAYGS